MLLVRQPRTAVLVALFPVTYYAVLGSGLTVFTRHMIPMVPFLCLTAGYFIAESASWVATLARRPRWRPALAALGVAGALLPSVYSVVMFDSPSRATTAGCWRGYGSSSASRPEPPSRSSGRPARPLPWRQTRSKVHDLRLLQRGHAARHRRGPRSSPVIETTDLGGMEKVLADGVRARFRARRRGRGRPAQCLRSAGQVLPAVRRFPRDQAAGPKSEGLRASRQGSGL